MARAPLDLTADQTVSSEGLNLAGLPTPRNKLSQWSLTRVTAPCWSSAVEVVHLNTLITITVLVRPGVATSCRNTPTDWPALNVSVRFFVCLFVVGIGDESNPSPECSIGRPRSPGPTSTSADWQMVHTKAQPCTCYSQDCTGYYVEAVVSEIRVSRRRYVNGRANGNEREDEEVCRRRSCLSADGSADRAALTDVLIIEEGDGDC